MKKCGKCIILRLILRRKDEGKLSNKNELKTGKGKKIILIVIIVDLILVGGGALVFFLLFKGETPEDLATRVVKASCEKDWKTIIYQTPDDVFDMLMKVDADLIAKKEITSSDDLRSWALEHAADLPDPMNGKVIMDFKIGQVKTMKPSKYIENYLGGEGDKDNAYYPFLKTKEEIAVVEVILTVADGLTNMERTSYIEEYKKNGNWYSLAGVQMIDSMLRTIE